MALRRHRLPRYWLGLTLGLVMVGIGGTYLWERQLPERLRRAGQQGDLEACLRYGEQLSALRWMGEQAPSELAECRRSRARQLWHQQAWAQALGLQLQLVNSTAATLGDRQQLQRWEDNLQQMALGRFQQGDLTGALTLLGAIGENHKSGGNSLGDKFREVWNSNRYQLERARKLSDQERWWEAVDALNRIDHPWWNRQSKALRQTVEAGINRLKGQEREHDSHGSLPHTVSSDQLDIQVQQRIAKGLDEWTAFQDACRALGGTVVEAGPESACRR